MSDISVKINDNDKFIINKNININNNADKPHNGKPITIMRVSPNGKCLVTYSKDDESIVGWNIANVEEGQLKSDYSRTHKGYHEIEEICVSDDKKLAYIHDIYLEIIDINNNQIIELNAKISHLKYHYCTFNLKGEFIFCNDVKNRHRIYHKIIWVYSTQTKNNKWVCKGIYKIPKDFELISISKYDKLYLFSNNNIYEWNILTEKSVRIFGGDEIYKREEFYKHDFRWRIKKDIRISSNEKFIYLRIKNKIIIYSIELKIPIISSLDINNGIKSYNLLNIPELYTLLLPDELIHDDVLSSNRMWNSIMEYCWKECLNHLEKHYQLQKKHQPESSTIPQFIFDIKTKYTFGILDGYVWKIKLEERISKMNENNNKLNNEIIVKGLDSEDSSSDDEADKIIDSDMYTSNVENKEIYNFLNIYLFNPYMNTIIASFQEFSEINELSTKNTKQVLIQNSTKWVIKSTGGELKLLIFKKIIINKRNKWKLICMRIDKFNVQEYDLYEFHKRFLHGNKLLSENDILILTKIGLFIYHFNENNNFISLNYFYYMNLNIYNKYELMKNLQYHYKKSFSKSTLPLPNYNSFKLSDKWVLYVKDNRESLLKYGVELLSFAIKEHRLELMDDIYRKCIIHFKEDLRNNKIFLSIITSTIPLLNEYYPEYILRYSLETTMVIDSLSYTIKYQDNNLHLYSFHYPQIINLTQSILWTKYIILYHKLYIKHYTLFIILNVIQCLLLLLILPISPIFLVTFYILSKYHFINDFNIRLYKNNIVDIALLTDNIFGTIFNEYDIFASFYFYINDNFLKYMSKSTTPTITFMIPYIKFVNYPQNYNWFWEFIRPQSSLFVKIISENIYKTWDGEALINFKWNTYGKYYYVMIWMSFIALLGCFNVSATIPQQYISKDVQKQLGFIHLSFEVRQIIYNPIKWICNFWNIFDIIAYVLPIFTSIYWIQTDVRNIQLLSFSCLFLDIKFLLFFRVFESFGVYFAIIISVAKQIVYFLVVLLIIIISFAHAFYILLSPTEIDFSFKENDPNNPWNIVPTYKEVLDNGAINSNSYIIQQPDDNTNMFTDYRTSLFAMYLFLTGDSSALSNWSYINNPSLVILIVLFSLLIVVYLMNLFIGLLNMAIAKDNNRISYLIQKAEILAEIELLYLLPNQRRWKAWFPETIYYYANFDKIHKEVKKLINDGQWDANEFSEIREMKQDLLNKLNIRNDETDQQLLKEIREILLNNKKNK
ncbi:hypothetical protein RhiirC2_770074 [Rhizophagus irregularis]|uniref:Ion transport domain-containing protein n=1 Tax=Rhizophagus irregularis TaxID=588596 RepID=A0A2N1NXM2_9GLOM|nr:hypothetical protein RhiirC2_770074 [Rhizophagus irregularis]